KRDWSSDVCSSDLCLREQRRTNNEPLGWWLSRRWQLLVRRCSRRQLQRTSPERLSESRRDKRLFLLVRQVPTHEPLDRPPRIAQHVLPRCHSFPLRQSQRGVGD